MDDGLRSILDLKYLPPSLSYDLFRFMAQMFKILKNYIMIKLYCFEGVSLFGCDDETV